MSERVVINDRSLFDRATATYAPEQIGRTRYRTPEGYLMCMDVRLARTGPMLYTVDELGGKIESAGTNMITVLRDADVLFNPDTILSFAGKPVTNDHPIEFVHPGSFQDASIGTCLNPRRGVGIDADYLIGDLLICDQQAIKDIDDLKREISLGYDADVEQIKPGLGRQTSVIGNHVAVVRRGRAGPSCAIRDGASEMAKPTRTWMDRIRTAFKANDEAALEEELSKAPAVEGDGDGHHVVTVNVHPGSTPVEDEDKDKDDEFKKEVKDAISTLTQGLTKVTDTIAALVKARDEDPTDKNDVETMDEDEKKEEGEDVDKVKATDAMSKAEILCPGISLPVFDSANSTVKGATITALRRKALKAAQADPARKSFVDSVVGAGASIDKMSPRTVAMAFNASAALAKAGASQGLRVQDRRFDVPQGLMTAAKLQERIESRRKANK